MLDLARHIVNSKSAQFEQEKFEDHYETAIATESGRPSGRPVVV
jgi:non-homologous end joining protein Ku